MICSYCEKTAFYQVRGRGFCKDHKAQAIRAEAKRQSMAKANAIRHENFNCQNAALHGGTTKASDRRCLMRNGTMMEVPAFYRIQDRLHNKRESA